jgi:hypothetical protein
VPPLFLPTRLGALGEPTLPVGPRLVPKPMKPQEPALGASCPRCGEWFASTMQMDAETWDRIQVRHGMMERCSHCQSASRFNKDDYSFRPD